MTILGDAINKCAHGIISVISTDNIKGEKMGITAHEHDESMQHKEDYKNKTIAFEEFLNKHKKNKLDLSSDQDLSIAVMNLISLEEHFFFSGAKTGNAKYYEMLQEIREVRKNLLKKLVPTYSDGSERWCISKHLLATSMRLMEVGTKQLDLGKKQESHDFFRQAYEIYSLFWGINLDIIGIGEVTNTDDSEGGTETVGSSISTGFNAKSAKKTGIKGMLGKVVQKLIDCCLE